MNKIKLSALGLATAFALFIPGVNAKEFTAAELKNLSETTVTIDGQQVTLQETMFVFGKHVFFNKITMADLVAASGTLNGDTAPTLFYKSGEGEWKDNVTNEPIEENIISSLKFDVLKIVKPQVEKAEDVNIEDGEVSVVGNVATITFEAEDNLTLNTIKKGEAVDIGETFTSTHAYNQGSISINFDKAKKTLDIVENRNLLTYDNSVSSEQWYSVVVDLGTNILDKDDNSLINVTWSDGTNYGIEMADVKDVVRHGGKEDTSFVMWLRGSNEDYSKSLVFMNTLTNEVTTLKVNYTAKNGFVYDTDKEVVVDNANASKVSYDATNKVFTTDTDVITFDFTVDEILYRAVKDENDVWSTYQVIVNKSIKLADVVEIEETINAKHKWNQESLSIPENGIIENNNKNASSIQINSSRILDSYVNGSGRDEKWYAVVVDLGVDPSKLKSVAGEGLSQYKIETADIADAARHGGTTDTSFVMWVSDLEDSKTIKFIYENNDNNSYTLEFKPINYTYTPLELTNARKANVPNEEAEYIANHTYNQNSFNISNEVLGQDDYVVTIDATRKMKKYTNSVGEESWYAVLVDFGVDPEKIEALDGYDIESIDVTDAARHGATGTEFILWLRGSSFDSEKTIEFKYAGTKDTVRVNFKFNAVDEIDLELFEPEEVSEISSEEVRFDSEIDAFIFRAYEKEEDQVNSFTAIIDGEKYRFDNYSGDWHIGKELSLAKAIKTNVLDGYTDAQKNNQNAINNVEVDGNIINVTFDRTLATLANGAGKNGKWYALALDLDVENEHLTTLQGYEIEECDKTEVQYHVSKDDYNDNLVIVWLNANVTNTDAGKTIRFVNTTNEEIVYSVTIKSHFEESVDVKYLNLKSAKKLDFTNVSKEETYYNEMVINNDAIKNVSIDTKNPNVINVIYDYTINNYNNGHAVAQWYGILVDMNIDKTHLSTNGEYTIEDVDKTDAVRFGGITDSNEIILWLRAEQTDESKTITFKNGGENPYDTLTVTIQSRGM